MVHHFAIPIVQAFELLLGGLWRLRQTGKASPLIMQIDLQLRDGDIRGVEGANCNFYAMCLVFICQRRAAVTTKPALVGVG